MARTSYGSPQFATRCGHQAFEYGWDVRTLILNEAGTCQALMAASGQALVDRYMAMARLHGWRAQPRRRPSEQRDQGLLAGACLYCFTSGPTLE